MVTPQHYASSPGNFFIDFSQVAIALSSEQGQLIVYLKNTSEPIVINTEPMQTEVLIASIIGWNHHCAEKNLSN